MAINKNSFILHESQRVVVIATGFTQRSKNPKTGQMIQIWILRRDVHPLEAVKNGADYAVCGDCPLRGEQGKNRTCYVQIGRAPSQIYKAYTAGHYQYLNSADYAKAFAGKFVRFGAYGEPTLVPFKMLEAIANASSGWTGYTHQWRIPFLSAYKRYIMASCDSSDYEQAIAMGWRTFTVSREHISNMIQCPASAERGHKVTCAECRLCGGTSNAKRSVQIMLHGNGAKYAA